MIRSFFLFFEHVQISLVGIGYETILQARHIPANKIIATLLVDAMGLNPAISL